MLSSNLEKSLHRALAHANDRRHKYATAEHLLLALTEDQDTVEVLLACNVDLDRLRREVLVYVDTELANLVDEKIEDDAKPTATFQRILQRAAIHVQASGREEITGANVLVAMFAERESHAAYFLQEQDMTRFDAVNYISHGIAKGLGRSEGGEGHFSDVRTASAQMEDWRKIETFVQDQTTNLMAPRDGRIDLAPSRASYEALSSRIAAARLAIEDLAVICRRGNQQHAALGDYAERYRAELERLVPSEPGIVWYVSAQKIENYRSNYVVVSKQQPGEYPPFEPALSTVIDAVVLATGILARLFPEIAKSQDDFEKYAGRQVGVRRAERELLDATLSDLAASDSVLTPRAAAVAKTIAELDPAATPEDAPETARTVATKSGFLRSFLSAIAKVVLEKAQTQVGYLRENLRTKGLYDVSKEIVKALVLGGFSSTVTFLKGAVPALLLLASQWPAMFGFIPPLLRLLGLH